MLEPETFEKYLEWRLLYPAEANQLDYDQYHDSHSELLGYLRWCKVKRIEATEKEIKGE